MQEKLLPNYFKTIAFPVGIICIIGLIFTGISAGSMPIDENIVEWILRNLLLISLIVMVSSREKEESAVIQKARYRELLSAVIFGVVIVVYDSVSNMFFSNGLDQMRSGYELMLMMLIYYLLFFFIRTKIKDPARHK